MSLGNHLRYMLYGGVVIFALLVVSGAPPSAALAYGVLLACPLMMIAMMLTMGGHGARATPAGPAPARMPRRATTAGTRPTRSSSERR